MFPLGIALGWIGADLYAKWQDERFKRIYESRHPE
jgi:hypothetical protein